MVFLIVISSIIMYLFVTVVLYHVTANLLVDKCTPTGCVDSYHDHEFNAAFIAALWPVSYIAWAVWRAIYDTGEWLGNKLS